MRLTTCLLLLIYFREGYSWGYRTQSGHGIIDAALPIDAWIPMLPEFVVFYMCGYLFVLVPCVLVRERHDFYAATVVFFVMLTTAFLTFRFAPIYMAKSYAVGSDWFSRLVHFQQAEDTAYNNFPSLHVAVNVYAFALIAWQWRQISFWWLPLPILIVASTLLIKQHLFVDVIGGLILAWGGFTAFRRLAVSRPRVAYRAWLAVTALLCAVVLINLERLGKAIATVGRFLDAGGLTPASAGVALLLFITAIIGIRLAVERPGMRRPPETGAGPKRP